MQKVSNNASLLDGTVLKAAVSPQIEVRYAGDGTLAAIYSTNSVDATQLKSNPFTADADGQYDFYIPNTRYTINATGGGIAGTETLSDQVAWDPAAVFNFSNLNSGYILQQNSAGVFTPVALSTLPFVNLTGVSCGAPHVASDPTSGYSVMETRLTGSGYIYSWLASSGYGGASAVAMRLFADGTLVVSGNITAAGVVLGAGVGGTTAANWGAVGTPIFTFSGDLNTGVFLPNSDNPAMAGGGVLLMDWLVTMVTAHRQLFVNSGGILVSHVASFNQAVNVGSAFTVGGGARVTGVASFNVAANVGSAMTIGGLCTANAFAGNATALTNSAQVITASKAIAAADFGITQVCSTATNITLTLSAGVNSGGPGRVLPIFRAGAGTVTVTSGGAVTILGPQFTVNSLRGASLEWIANDVWLFRV